MDCLQTPEIVQGGGGNRNIFDGVAEFYNETDKVIRKGVTRVECDPLEGGLFFS